MPGKLEDPEFQARYCSRARGATMGVFQPFPGPLGLIDFRGGRRLLFDKSIAMFYYRTRRRAHVVYRCTGGF